MPNRKKIGIDKIFLLTKIHLDETANEEENCKRSTFLRLFCKYITFQLINYNISNKKSYIIFIC